MDAFDGALERAECKQIWVRTEVVGMGTRGRRRK